MRSVDTNVLIRLIVRDDRDQAERAEAFEAPGAWVSRIVLAALEISQKFLNQFCDARGGLHRKVVRKLRPMDIPTIR